MDCLDVVTQEVQALLAEQKDCNAQLRAKLQALQDSTHEHDVTSAGQLPELRRRIEQLTASHADASAAARFSAVICCLKPFLSRLSAVTCIRMQLGIHSNPSEACCSFVLSV